MDLARLQPNTFTTSTQDLAVDALWEVVSNPLLLPDLSSELQAVRIITDGPVALGTQFEGDQQRGDRRWTTTSTVTGFEPYRLFEWTVGDMANPVSTWSFVLDANGAGTTVAHAVTLRGGPSPLSDVIAQHPNEAEKVVVERLGVLRDRMAATLAGLIELAMLTKVESSRHPRRTGGAAE